LVFWGWQPRERHIPGGILDSAGQHFRILDLTGWYDKPERVPAWLMELVTLLFTRVRLVLERPEQLNLHEFKEKICAIVRRGREHKVQKSVRLAGSYEECIHALFPASFQS
jgi:hypothetical protein